MGKGARDKFKTEISLKDHSMHVSHKARMCITFKFFARGFLGKKWVQKLIKPTIDIEIKHPSMPKRIRSLLLWDTLNVSHEYNASCDFMRPFDPEMEMDESRLPLKLQYKGRLYGIKEATTFQGLICKPL